MCRRDALGEPLANTPGWSLEEVSNYDERGPIFYWNSLSGSGTGSIWRMLR